MRRTLIVSVAISMSSCVASGSGGSKVTTATGGMLAHWDMCSRVGPMEIIDPEGGSRALSLDLAGRPSWSPDARTIAS